MANDEFGTLFIQAQENATQANQQITILQDNVQSLQFEIIKNAKLHAQQLNVELHSQVDQLKDELIALEITNGIKQYGYLIPRSSQKLNEADGSEVTQQIETTPTATIPSKATGTSDVEKLDKMKCKKQPKEQNKSTNIKDNIGGDAKTPNPARLDLRVARVLSAKKHPEADTLYVEEMDCGEDMPRTVVSGLVKHISVDELVDSMVVLLCNLKPAKMRGVVSSAMVMCASTPDKVELLQPPDGAAVGDRVTFPSHPGHPDEQLNPKKKIWEGIQCDLKVSGDGIATYKGDPFTVSGKGVCTASTLRLCGIR